MKLIPIIFSFLFFISCIKERRYENYLEGKTFISSLLVVDGSVQYVDEYLLEFFDCKNKKNLCLGIMSKNSQTISYASANFNWKFDNHGMQFQISNQSSSDGSPSNQAITECYNISGTYEVKSFKKNSSDNAYIMKLESYSTYGYGDKKVEITLTEKK